MEKEKVEARLREISWEVAELEEEAHDLERQLALAARDERTKEREAISRHQCTCGHERRRHGKSFNINYTQGACRDCKCKNFLQK